VANAIIAISDGAGFFSLQYGLFDCLRGFNPDIQDTDAPFPIVQIISAVECYNVLVNDTDIDFQSNKRCLQQLEKHLEITGSLSDLQTLSLMVMIWAADSLQGHVLGRLRVVKLRIRCLSALIHSRVSADTLLKFLSSDGVLLRDLLTLSDMSSQRTVDLLLSSANQVALSAIALDCCVMILRCSLRRRGMYAQVGIDKHLGLSRPSLHAETPDSIGGSHEFLWVSTVLAGCSVAQSALRSGVPLWKLCFGSSATSEPNDAFMDRNEREITGILYLRIGLEYFATALSAQDIYTVTSDSASLVGALGYFLRGTQGYLAMLFDTIFSEENKARRNKSKAKSLLAEPDKQLMWTISKSLACLDLGFEEQEYQTVMRSSDVIGIVASLLEQFSAYDIISNQEIGIAAKSVVENALSLITHSLNRSRRSMLNAFDSGIQILYRPFFPKLCSLVFESPNADNEYLWFHVLSIIRAGINVEPTFLGQFLRAPYVTSLKKILMKMDDSGVDESIPFCMSLSMNADLMLVPIAKLAHELCITSDGQAFVRESGIINAVINAFVSPMLVLPKSMGISSDTAAKCGRSLTQIMRDYPIFKESIKRQFQVHFVELCNDAKSIGQSILCTDDATLNSSRMRVLQQLSNLFNLVEHLGVDGRRQSSDAVRDILSKEIIEVLVDSFECTLPPGRQLLAQVSTRCSFTSYIGHSSSVKSLISMLKIVTHVAPHILLPVLLMNVEEILNNIAHAKVALARHQTRHDVEEYPENPPAIDNPLNEQESSFNVQFDKLAGSTDKKKSRRRSRTDGIHPGPKDNERPQVVPVLGVLNLFPQECMFAGSFDNMNQPYAESIWKFLRLIMKLEWITDMMSYCVRILSRMSSSTPIMLPVNKDSIRRLLDFHRVAMLEVCRFASSRQKPRELRLRKLDKDISESFCSFDSSEDGSPVERVPGAFKIRIINPEGVVVKEECESEGSRIVMVAAYGSECWALERRKSSSGISRYRTSRGWISEHRKEPLKDQLVEIVDVLSRSTLLSSCGNAVGNTPASLSSDKYQEMFTIQEAACNCMSVVIQSLRQFEAYLVRLTSMSTIGNRDDGRGSTHASNLSTLLASFVASLFSRPLDLLQTSDLPHFSRLSEIHQKPVSYATVAAVRPLSSHGSRVRNGFQGTSDETEDLLTRDVKFDSTAVCLFYCAAVNSVVLHLLRDKHGSYNSNLLGFMVHHKVVDLMLDATSFTLAVFTDSASELNEPITPKSLLSAPAVSAFNAAAALLALVKEFVTVTFNPIPAMTVQPSTPQPGIDTHSDLALQSEIVFKMAVSFLPKFQKSSITSNSFPSELVVIWMNVISGVLQGLDYVNNSKATAATHRRSVENDASPRSRMSSNDNARPSFAPAFHRGPRISRPFVSAPASTATDSDPDPISNFARMLVLSRQDLQGTATDGPSNSAASLTPPAAADADRDPMNLFANLFALDSLMEQFGVNLPNPPDHTGNPISQLVDTDSNLSTVFIRGPSGSLLITQPNDQTGHEDDEDEDLRAALELSMELLSGSGEDASSPAHLFGGETHGPNEAVVTGTGDTVSEIAGRTHTPGTIQTGDDDIANAEYDDSTIGSSAHAHGTVDSERSEITETIDGMNGSHDDAEGDIQPSESQDVSDMELNARYAPSEAAATVAPSVFNDSTASNAAGTSHASSVSVDHLRSYSRSRSPSRSPSHSPSPSSSPSNMSGFSGISHSISPVSSLTYNTAASSPTTLPLAVGGMEMDYGNRGALLEELRSRRENRRSGVKYDKLSQKQSEADIRGLGLKKVAQSFDQCILAGMVAICEKAFAQSKWSGEAIDTLIPRLCEWMKNYELIHLRTAALLDVPSTPPISCRVMLFRVLSDRLLSKECPKPELFGIIYCMVSLMVSRGTTSTSSDLLDEFSAGNVVDGLLCLFDAEVYENVQASESDLLWMTPAVLLLHELATMTKIKGSSRNDDADDSSKSLLNRWTECNMMSSLLPTATKERILCVFLRLVKETDYKHRSLPVMTCQSIVYGIADLITDPHLADVFFELDGFATVISVSPATQPETSVSGSTADVGALLSKLVTHSLKTETDEKQQYFRRIVSVFRSRNGPLPLSAFMQSCEKELAQNPNTFMKVFCDVVDVRSHGGNESTTYTVKLIEDASKSLTGNYHYSEVEINRIRCVCECLLKQAVVRNSVNGPRRQQSRLFSTTDIFHVISDYLVRNPKVAENVSSFDVQNAIFEGSPDDQSVDGHEDQRLPTFPYWAIQTYFDLDSSAAGEGNAALEAELQASFRLLVICSTSSSDSSEAAVSCSCRAHVYSAMLKSLAILEDDAVEFADRKLLLLKRLTSLFTCSVCNSTSHSDAHGKKDAVHSVSSSALAQIVTLGIAEKLLVVLSKLLSALKDDDGAIAPVVNKLLELLDYICRPPFIKYLKNLERNLLKKGTTDEEGIVDGANWLQPVHAAVCAFISVEDAASSSPLDSNKEEKTDLETASASEGPRAGDLPTADADAPTSEQPSGSNNEQGSRNDLSDDESVGDGVDGPGAGLPEDNEEDNEEEEDEEDDDDEDDDEDEDEDEADAVVESFGEPDPLRGLQEEVTMLENMLLQEPANGASGLNFINSRVRERPATNSIFATPPEQVRSDAFSMFLSELNGDIMDPLTSDAFADGRSSPFNMISELGRFINNAAQTGSERLGSDVARESSVPSRLESVVRPRFGTYSHPLLVQIQAVSESTSNASNRSATPSSSWVMDPSYHFQRDPIPNEDPLSSVPRFLMPRQQHTGAPHSASTTRPTESVRSSPATRAGGTSLAESFERFVHRHVAVPAEPECAPQLDIQPERVAEVEPATSGEPPQESLPIPEQPTEQPQFGSQVTDMQTISESGTATEISLQSARAGYIQEPTVVPPADPQQGCSVDLPHESSTSVVGSTSPNTGLSEQGGTEPAPDVHTSVVGRLSSSSNLPEGGDSAADESSGVIESHGEMDQNTYAYEDEELAAAIAASLQRPAGALDGVGTSTPQLQGAENTVPLAVAGDTAGSGELSSDVTAADSGHIPGSAPASAVVHAVQCPPGYEEEVFYSLPESMQQEIWDQHATTTASSGAGSERELIEAAGYVYEIFMDLPDSMRQEILQQARQEQQANAGSAAPSTGPAEIDNATFLQSLAPELRAEILLSAEPAFLDSLPPDLVGEANMLRERAAASWQARSIPRSLADPAQSTHRRYAVDEGNDSNHHDKPTPGTKSLSSKKHNNGHLIIPVDIPYHVTMSPRIIIVLLQLLKATHVPLDNAILNSILTSICRSGQLRPFVLVLMIGLLTEDVTLISCATRMFLNMTQADAQANTQSVDPDDFIDRLKSLLPCSHRALKRIMAVFVALADSVNVIVDVLKERDREIDEEDLGPNSAEESRAVAVQMNPARSGSASLFASVVSLCAESRYYNSSHELHILTSLLCKLTAPLEHFVENADKAETKLQPHEHTEVVVRIPSVTLTESTLRVLCDVFASDQCNNAVFDDTTRVIWRLAMIPSNAVLLKDQLLEVLSDLTQDSKSKLKGVLCKLESSHSADMASASLVTDSTATLVPHMPIGDLGSKVHEKFYRSLKTLHQLTNKIHLDFVNVIPFEDMGTYWWTFDRVIEKLRRSLMEGDEDHVSSSTGACADTVRNSSTSSSSRGQAPINSPTGSATKNEALITSSVSRLLPIFEAFFLLFSWDIMNQAAAASKPPVPSAILAVPDPAANADTASVPDLSTQNECTAPAIVATGSSDLSAAADNPAPNVCDTSVNATTAAIKAISHMAMPGARHRASERYRSLNLPLITTSLFEREDSTGSRYLYRSRSLRTLNSFGSAAPSSPSSSMREGAFGWSANNPVARSQCLVGFANGHKEVLNMIVRYKPSLLDTSSSPFSCLIRISALRNVLQFDNKRKYFNDKMQSRRSSSATRGIHLQLRREHLFEDSFHQLRNRSQYELQGKLRITFHSEEGIDAGGLSREWFSVIAREIFNPNYCLFTTAADGVTFQPNPISMINTNHLDYFKFIGIIIGKAIYDGQLLDAHFTRSFYKHLLGLTVDYTDIEAIEPEYYKSLKQILEFSLQDLGLLDLTFSTESLNFGKLETVDLIPNGRRIPVTEENKFEYVQLITHHRMTAAIKSQIDCFLDGFYELVPADLISIFSPQELELLICGLPDVDLEDLAVNTDYHQYKENDEIIHWFWEVLHGFTREERAMFLQFVTGTSKVSVLYTDDTVNNVVFLIFIGTLRWIQ
jgi:hypothetical protein